MYSTCRKNDKESDNITSDSKTLIWNKKEVKNRYDILDIKDGGKADNDIRRFGIVTKER